MVSVPEGAGELGGEPGCSSAEHEVDLNTDVLQVGIVAICSLCSSSRSTR